MTLANLVTYISIMLALAIIPGPSMILAFTEGALIGVLKTIPTALGNMVAALMQAAIALFLINHIASISVEMQSTIQIIGALFIAYLGWSLIRAKQQSAVTVDSDYHARSSLMRFVNGFSISAFNPKSIFFFASLFPQLVEAGKGYTVLDYMSFFGPIVIVGFGVFLAFSVAGKTAQAAFGNSKIFENLPLIMGSFLLCFSFYALFNTYTLLASS